MKISPRGGPAAGKLFSEGLFYGAHEAGTDKPKSYTAAKAEVLPGVEYRQQKYQNNRAGEFASANQVAGG